MEYLRYKRADLIVSLDETRISTMSKGEKQAKGLCDGPDDHGETLTLRGGKGASLMGGMFGDFTSALPMIVYNSGDSASPQWGRTWPDCKFSHNRKGSFDEERFTDYLQNVLYPVLVQRGCGVDDQWAYVVWTG